MIDYLSEQRSLLIGDRCSQAPSLTFKNGLFDKVQILIQDEYKYDLTTYCTKLTEDVSYFKQTQIKAVLHLNFWQLNKPIEDVFTYFSGFNLVGIKMISKNNIKQESQIVIRLLKKSEISKKIMIEFEYLVQFISTQTSINWANIESKI